MSEGDKTDPWEIGKRPSRRVVMVVPKTGVVKLTLVGNPSSRGERVEGVTPQRLQLSRRHSARQPTTRP